MMLRLATSIGVGVLLVGLAFGVIEAIAHPVMDAMRQDGMYWTFVGMYAAFFVPFVAVIEWNLGALYSLIKRFCPDQ